MKVAVQIQLLPGDTDADRVRWAEDHGVQGIELNAFHADSLVSLERQAETVARRLPVVAVCGNFIERGGRWETAFDFLHPTPALRRDSVTAAMRLLELCGRFGAVGQVVPPIFGPAVLPDLTPVMSVTELEDALMVSALRELGPVAAEHETHFLLEPLNRFEQHYLRRQSDAARAISAAGVPGVGLLSDLFHMNIEEPDLLAALRESAATHTRHIHVADNTRMEPGAGNLDWRQIVETLKEAGYDGYLSYECGVRGDNHREKAERLAASVGMLRRLTG